MNPEEYRKFDAVDLAALVRTKQVSVQELLTAAIQSVEAVNDQLNAVLGAIEGEHDLVDQQGPLYGVPFVIKDLVLHRKGGLLEMGSRMARGLISPSDTELMKRFRRAGLIAFARTATPELGHGCTTESVLNGPTRNPWDLTRMAGGSSGGSAAAVAAGITPVAHANDGAGSIRIPASCCGLFGLKPTRGRVSLGPDVGEALFGMGIENTVSRTVRDSAVVLDCIQGPAAGDPYVIASPARPYAAEVATPPERLRIAFTTKAWSGALIDRECVEATEATAKLCAELGHYVEQARPDFDYAIYRDACIRGWAAGIVTWVEALRVATQREPSTEFLETATLSGYEFGKSLSAAQILEVPAALNRVCRSVGPFFEDFDVLLTPTTSRPAAPLGTYNQNAQGLTTQAWFDQKAAFAPFLALFNVTGQPAMTMPLAVSSGGLPLGLQFVGRCGAEGSLFRLAGQLEAARPWKGRWPKLITAS